MKMTLGFKENANRCAEILDLVLVGRIANADELEKQWPPEAAAYELLDTVLNDAYEFLALEPMVAYRDILETSVDVLRSASDDPQETLARLQNRLDALE